MIKGQTCGEKQGFDHFLYLKHKILTTEYLKLAGGWNPPSDMSIRVDIFPSQLRRMSIRLDKSQKKLKSQDQRRKKKRNTYAKYKQKLQNETSLNLENRIIEIQRFIVIKPQEESPLAIQSPFSIEKNNNLL